MPNAQPPTTASLLTPPGEGGIGVIRVAGPGAVALAQSMFRGRRPVELAQTAGQLLYGHLMKGGEPLDEVLVAVVDARPEWGVVEINCHGGIVAVERILAELEARGVRRVPADSSADAPLDAIQREAAVLIPGAPSKAAVRMLLAQYHGELSRAIREIASLPAGDAAAALDRLSETARLGFALCRPTRVVIAGSPNTGKSTLFNALIGQARAIVTDIPGTTRDYITETIVIDGLPFELVDTAGLRDTDHVVEIEGINRARIQISEADVVLFMLDASAGETAAAEGDRILADIERAHGGRPGAVIRVVNKIDLAPAPPPASDLAISALRGDGIRELERRLLHLTAGSVRYAGGAMVFTARQLQAIDSARAELRTGEAEAFRSRLLGLLVRRNEE